MRARLRNLFSALTVVSSLALIVIWWRFSTRSTVQPITVKLVATDSIVSKTVSSAVNKVDEDELDEFVQILQERQDNYTGRLYNWTRNHCHNKTGRSQTCFDTNCPRQFSQMSLRERLRQVLATRAPLPEKYMHALASAARSVTPHKYIFVTGASSNHFLEMQALLDTMFKFLLPKMKGEDYALVIYNLGLTEEERNLTKKNCRCTVVDFPFSEMPPDGQKIRCYIWKPLIAASLLEKTEYLTWMDASIRFRDSDPFPELFYRARDRGIQIRSNTGCLAVRTRPSMADFFGDKLCQYSSFTELEANFFILYNNRFTREAIMKPWLTCAFAKDCICVTDPRCHKEPNRQYGICHRYDQSSIGMIFSKLYLEKRPMLEVPFIKIERTSKLNWFKSR